LWNSSWSEDADVYVNRLTGASMGSYFYLETRWVYLE